MKIISDSSFDENLVPFNRNFFNSGNKFTTIGSGALGGKAKSLAFIHNHLGNSDKLKEFSQFEISIPNLTVIRTDIFDSFLKRNNLFDIAYSDEADDRIAYAFQKADLPIEIIGDLRGLISQVHTPLAVRSSSMLEDALYKPFAGIYETKMIPNNQHDTDTRFQKLVEAIKLVYASTFFRAAKDYIRATDNDPKEEKMAVIIQEIVGQKHAESFYPELSGVARSYNFYSSGRAKPKDGIVNLALGLGKTIVDGSLSWSYSPTYPKINPPFGSINEFLKNTQIDFWAVNMGKPSEFDPIRETEYLVQASIQQAEKDETLLNLVSTFDPGSDRITIGMDIHGPRILTFAPLLNWEILPLNKLLKELISLSEEALETPVEIEFAMTFANDKKSQSKHRLGFLQVRPMVVSTEEVDISTEDLNGPDVLIASRKVLGNGILQDIQDVVFVKPRLFNAANTRLIASEIAAFNRKLISDKKPYLLIGFGRWGSSDSWLGIPVNWGQISGVKVIIEATLPNMNIDLSQGSHFFHNLTSFKVSYFSVPFTSDLKIDWNWLNKQKIEGESEYVCHTKLVQPLQIKVDGKSGRGIILKK